MSEANDEINKALLYANTAEDTRAALDAGADVNATNDDGYTALILAFSAEQTRLLLEANADANAQSVHGTTPLMRSINAEQARLLIEAGADVNAKDEMGMTALMYAGLRDQAELLIRSGANLYAKNRDGKTAYDQLKFKFGEEFAVQMDAVYREHTAAVMRSYAQGTSARANVGGYFARRTNARQSSEQDVDIPLRNEEKPQENIRRVVRDRFPDRR